MFYLLNIIQFKCEDCPFGSGCLTEGCNFGEFLCLKYLCIYLKKIYIYIYVK
ncbi:hypothetical protein BCR36DRAFT_156438 [Piromyces finnis]|uniref:Uncharacterized protein n=1 Tax=Piromyces finnis TaxID=1754191 RepID=A0A1Y1UX30_9FUNG|nr:hypothetical protein BCR36DRAFT_156438 [Piromyces finnis]|eukprot:ORX42611.1 hypothetical protein BCR36DRAFT_156438 [Piromyces finnis]